MSRPAMRLDFATKRRRLQPRAMALLVCGLLSLTFVLSVYQDLHGRAEALRLRLADLEYRPVKAGSDDDGAGRAAAEAAEAVAELATPWAQLLAELEDAAVDSRGSVALLAIEPDRVGNRVEIQAEARTLPAAVEFAARLQQSNVLRYPLLDSHEVRTDDRYRPVRFQVTAAWRLGS